MMGLKIVPNFSNSHLGKLSKLKDKKVKTNRIALVVLTLMLSLSFGAMANELTSPRVAVADLRGALMGSAKVQEELKKAEQQLSGEQSRARQLAEEARSLQERLQRDSSIMSDDERRKVTQQVEQKVQEYQFIASRLQNQMQEIQQEIGERYRPSLEKAVNELLEEYKIDILLDRQAVAFARPKFDLTQAIAEKLNKAK